MSYHVPVQNLMHFMNTTVTLIKGYTKATGVLHLIFLLDLRLSAALCCHSYAY